MRLFTLAFLALELNMLKESVSCSLCSYWFLACTAITPLIYLAIHAAVYRRTSLRRVLACLTMFCFALGIVTPRFKAAQHFHCAHAALQAAGINNHFYGGSEPKLSWGNWFGYLVRPVPSMVSVVYRSSAELQNLIPLVKFANPTSIGIRVSEDIPIDEEAVMEMIARQSVVHISIGIYCPDIDRPLCFVRNICNAKSIRNVQITIMRTSRNLMDVPRGGLKQAQFDSSVYLPLFAADHIESINIGFCSNDDLLWKALPHNRTLKVLVVGSKIPDSALNYILRLETLERLSIHCGDAAPNLAELGRLPSLRLLELSCDAGVTADHPAIRAFCEKEGFEANPAPGPPLTLRRVR